MKGDANQHTVSDLTPASWGPGPLTPIADQTPIGLLGASRLAGLILHAPATPEFVETMPIDQLERHCLEETIRYLAHWHHDDRFGYQLFRRAIVERDQAAWAAIERIYHGQLTRWARAHRLFGQAGEEAEALANRALAYVWQRIDAAGFADFPTLSSLLAYLHRCISSMVVDQVRLRLREQRRAEAMGLAIADAATPTPQNQALDQARADEIWAMVDQLCRDDQERRLAYCHLVLEMRPAEILACHPDQFDHVGIIYTQLATLLKRLRRNPLLRQQCQETLAMTPERARRTPPGEASHHRPVG